jgi:hypothetical protein
MARRSNIGVKALLVVLIAIALVFGESDRFNDKAMGARAIAYPLLCAVPGLVWWFVHRRRPTLRYPHLADALVTASFVVDLGGNALDLFDRLTWFDDAAHFTNWFLLGLALGFTLRHTRPPWETVWLVTGAGAVAAILWELAEYQSFVQKVEQLGIYRDTIGDLCLGTAGALVAGLLVVGTRRMTAFSGGR